LLAVILNTLIFALIFSMRIRSREMRLFSAFSSGVSSPRFGFFFGISLFFLVKFQDALITAVILRLNVPRLSRFRRFPRKA
jgi:hypothetical protein